MKRFFPALLGCLLAATAAHAQADHKLDPKVLKNDTVILNDFIKPALSTAKDQNQEPDWKMLRTTIVSRFDESYGDRSITKAKIYYFYSRDWVQFSAALVLYTQQYEFKDDLATMNHNAKMVLNHSQNPTEWKAAQSWVKYATEKAPSIDAYKATYDALTEKIEAK